ncbi:MAG TPA: hypothetical protein VFD58_02285 [Blastocatellia bacterium]|nr:hypothetical protein [Blastocatellia bacterium]
MSARALPRDLLLVVSLEVAIARQVKADNDGYHFTQAAAAVAPVLARRPIISAARAVQRAGRKSSTSQKRGRLSIRDSPPVEAVWQQLKQVELCNLWCDDLSHQLTLARRRLRNKPDLIQSFFAQAGLEL